MPVKPTVIALENVVGSFPAMAAAISVCSTKPSATVPTRSAPRCSTSASGSPIPPPRFFIVAVQDHLDTTALEDHGLNWLHPDPVLKAIAPLDDIVFWAIPSASKRPHAVEANGPSSARQEPELHQRRREVDPA